MRSTKNNKNTPRKGGKEAYSRDGGVEVKTSGIGEVDGERIEGGGAGVDLWGRLYRSCGGLEM